MGTDLDADSYTITISPHTNDPGQQVVKLVSQSALSKLASQENYGISIHICMPKSKHAVCVSAH